jgi:multiple sugar transport system permease protein
VSGLASRTMVKSKASRTGGIAPVKVPSDPRPLSRRVRRRRQQRVHDTFVLPGVGYLLVFALYPLYQLIVMSVSDVSSANILTTWPGVGLGNFRATTGVPDFSEALAHTVVLVVIALVVNLVGGTVAALSMRADGWATKVVLSLMVFVWALPGVVVGNLWRFLLTPDGPVNALLVTLHIVAAPIPWLVNGQLALLSLSLVNAWMVLPFSTLVMRAAVLDVPRDQLEAAALDGAGAVGQFRNVIMPHIRPTLSALAILLVVNGFRSFDLIYVMTSGGPGTATSTLPFLAYRQAVQEFQFGLGAATAVFSLALVFVFAVIYGIASRQRAEL